MSTSKPGAKNMQESPALPHFAVGTSNPHFVHSVGWGGATASFRLLHLYHASTEKASAAKDLEWTGCKTRRA
jgi:hypothetical protein